MRIMRRQSKIRAQSIIEYLAVLMMLLGGLVVGTILFGRGVSNGLTGAAAHVSGTLPQAVDNTHQANVITFDVTYQGGQ